MLELARNTNIDQDHDQLDTTAAKYNVQEMDGSTIIDHISGGTQYFGDVTIIYTNRLRAEILFEQTIASIIGEHFVVPSNLDDLRNALSNERVILLEAPEQWGRQYVAGALAIDHLRRYQGIPDASALDLKVWTKEGNVSGSTILEALARQSGSETAIRNAVLYIPNISPNDYNYEVLERLRHIAAENELFIILTTSVRRGEWLAAWSKGKPGLFSLGEQSPYSADDMASWAASVINHNADVLARLISLQIVDADT